MAIVMLPMPRLIRSPRRVWDPGMWLAFSPMMLSLCDDSSVGSCDRLPIDLIPTVKTTVETTSTMPTDFLLLDAWFVDGAAPTVDGAAPTVDPFLL